MDAIRKLLNYIQEYSIPLILGVIASLVVANIDGEMYHHLVDYPIFGKDAAFAGHKITLHFLINDIFMVLFFGIAAKEITESVLPGGPLNPISKAINPLLGTLGGVLGPVGVFFILSFLFYSGDAATLKAVNNGWGIPTATDIALAWLVARLVFGKGHPAVNFLLLLAVADDAIGLGIIAIFYPSPDHPVEPIWLLLTAAGVLVAFLMRKMKIMAWVPYILFAGTLSWLGLLFAHLHPALALVPIVPFLPGPEFDTGLFAPTTSEEEAEHNTEEGHGVGHGHSPLETFEHENKLFVDMGLFFFAFANAGVGFSSINGVTWIILASLIVGKTLGIGLMSGIGAKIGFPLPEGMGSKHLVVAGVIAGLGLTVALFVAGEAYPAGDAAKSIFQGPAKMGAVFSAGAAFLALILGKVLKVKDGPTSDGAEAGGHSHHHD